MTRRLTAGLGLLVMLLAACATETVAPNEGTTSGPAVQPTITVNTVLVDRITEGLTCLYGDGVVPNPSSTLGKLKSLVNEIEANDPIGALGSYDVLYGFLYKWQNADKTDGEAVITCDPRPTWLAIEATVDDLFGLIYADLATLVDSFAGEFCTFTGVHTCIDQNNDAAVYFPPDLYTQLTSVYIETYETGAPLQGTLKEYPTYVKILTTGINTFTGANKPLVVVCFNETVRNNPISILSRLLLGSKHTGIDPLTGQPYSTFKLLPKPIDREALATEIATLLGCGDPPTSSVLGLSSNTFLGRLVNRVADAILPQALQAQWYDELAFGGVGGSAEEFSEFGAVDPGMDFGGVGGSAEEFSPGMMPSGPEKATYDPSPERYVGDIGEVWSGADVPSGSPALPRVQVVAAGTTNGVGGLNVKFELLDPTSTSLYYGQDSDAEFATSPGSVLETGVTDGDGYATVPPINFGPTPGYRWLKVSVQPSGLKAGDPPAPVLLACIVDADTDACAPNEGTDVNGFSTQATWFLIETYEPPSNWACTMGSRAGKVNFGDYSSTTFDTPLQAGSVNAWHAYFQAPAPSYSAGTRAARIRQVNVVMSVTGRSSSTSDWPVKLEAWSNGFMVSSGYQTLIDTAATPLGNLRLPGDNGNGIPVKFVLTPTGAPELGPVTYYLSVASESNRVPQLWYNSSKLASTDLCYQAVVYQNGTTPPGWPVGTDATAKETYRGLIIDANNFPW